MVFSKYIMPAMDKTKHFQIDLNFLLDLKKKLKQVFLCYSFVSTDRILKAILN